ncbi:hypothetical protein ACGFNF_09215 [Micromonospora sp. NPDC048868]|uniref:hypothetical protein n=1 Tax=Micromonospora sp. NPDC048868 TaxID=3364258 RepID=UPI0037169CBA
MDGDEEGLTRLVQQLYDATMALEFIAKFSVRPEDFDECLRARDELAHDVLVNAAERLTLLLNRQISVDDLWKLGRSEALSLLTPGLVRRQAETLKALERALDHQPRRERTVRDVTDPAPGRGSDGPSPIAGIALAVGIAVLAATAAAPIAALAVQESIAKEIVKAAINGLVAGTVTELALRTARPGQRAEEAPRVSDQDQVPKGGQRSPMPVPKRGALPPELLRKVEDRRHATRQPKRPEGPHRGASGPGITGP